MIVGIGILWVREGFFLSIQFEILVDDKSNEAPVILIRCR